MEWYIINHDATIDIHLMLTIEALRISSGHPIWIERMSASSMNNNVTLILLILWDENFWLNSDDVIDLFPRIKEDEWCLINTLKNCSHYMQSSQLWPFISIKLRVTDDGKPIENLINLFYCDIIDVENDDIANILNPLGQCVGSFEMTKHGSRMTWDISWNVAQWFFKSCHFFTDFCTRVLKITHCWKDLFFTSHFYCRTHTGSYHMIQMSITLNK